MNSEFPLLFQLHPFQYEIKYNSIQKERFHAIIFFLSLQTRSLLSILLSLSLSAPTNLIVDAIVRWNLISLETWKESAHHTPQHQYASAWTPTPRRLLLPPPSWAAAAAAAAEPSTATTPSSRELLNPRLLTHPPPLRRKGIHQFLPAKMRTKPTSLTPPPLPRRAGAAPTQATFSLLLAPPGICWERKFSTTLWRPILLLRKVWIRMWKRRSSSPFRHNCRFFISLDYFIR